MMPSGKPVLAAEHISRSFGAVAALRDASICIEEGQIQGLVGDNRAGKSTLIKLDRAMRNGARDVLDDLSVKIPPVNANVDQMSGGQRQCLDALALLDLFGGCRDAGR